MADGEDEFQLVTKGHRLCAKGQTTIPTRVRNFSVLSNSDKDCFIDKDILCKRIIQKKYVSVSNSYQLRFVEKKFQLHHMLQT